MRWLRGRQSGQSLTEYVLLIAVIAGIGKFLMSQMPALLQKVSAPFKDNYARAYKYGRPDACGIENDPPSCGGQQNHPKYKEGNKNHMFARGA